MKYVALLNKPNVSESRLENVSPSLKLDDRNFPHIAWLSKRDGANEVNYRYWDGLQWAFNGLPTVYKSKETIVYSPNSLVLDSDENPVIAFSRRSALGSKHSIATSPLMNGVWTFNELDVDYSVGWIGVVKPGGEIDVSSSSSSSSSSSHGSTSSISSSSSFEEAVYFVVAYDIINQSVKIYSVNQSWTLIGTMVTSIENASTIKIDSCGSKIGIAYFDDNGIWYNFFDTNTQTWTHVSFNLSAASELYGSIRDMDFGGYHDASNGYMAIGWVSGDSTTSYVCNILIQDDGAGTETPADGTNDVVESSSVAVTCSSDYVVNGYRRIAVCLDNNGVPQMIVSGATSKIFFMFGTTVRVRTNSAIDVESPSNGIVPSLIRIAFKDVLDVALSASLDTGDIYYFEASSDAVFPISSPDMTILNSDWIYHVIYQDGQLQGTPISDTYDSYCADVFGESKRPVVVASDRTLFPPVTTTTTTTVPPITTTTTTTGIACCSNLGPPVALSPSGCVLSSWNINWMGHDIAGCSLYIAIAYPSAPGMGFIIYEDIELVRVRAYGVAVTNAAQTITLIPTGANQVGGTVYWNGIQRLVEDGNGPWTIHC